METIIANIPGEYKIIHNSEGIDKKLTLRGKFQLDNSYSNQCDEFLKHFSLETCTQWIVFKTYSNLQKIDYRKDFACQHNKKKTKKGKMIVPETEIWIVKLK